jgi:DNA-directed RNA polymerase
MKPEEDLREEEIKLETDGISQSLSRFRQDADRTPLAASAGGTALLRLAHPPLSQAILEDQARIRKGWKPRHWAAMVSLPADKLALIALSSLLNALGEAGDDPDGLTVTSVSGRIGYGCMRERRGDTLRGRAIPLSEVAAARNKKPSHAKKRGRDQEEDIDGTDWKLTYLDIRLGGALVDLALKHSGILEERRVWMGAATLHLTPQAAARFIETEGAKERSIRPAFLPMIIPPLPWKGGRGGGYLAFEVGLVKRDFETRETKGVKAGLRVPCQALNAIQETAWRLNGRIAEILRTAWDRKMPAGVLPPTTVVNVPPRPSKKSMDSEKYQELRYEYEEARRRASRVLSQHAIMGNRLAICDLFAGRKVFYFPHQLDHRGRAYAIPQAVNPQADDIGRALLEFASGKPLGDRGPYWLAVHLANLYGHRVDKLPFEGRIRWVEEHKEAILDSALRPLDGGLFWTEAEKPWRFLAAAFEWAGYLEGGASFVSHIPVAVDGTANGLQHLSALGRDPEGGRFTNLVPGPKPEDIYQVVADRLEKMVGEDAAQGLKKAKEWQGAIDRKLVKQPTMTTPYGITEEGVIGQILEIISGGPPGRFKSPWNAAIYLAPKVKDAIGQVVVKATLISGWLQGIAQTLASEGGCGVRWRVPTGFPVLHERWNEEIKRVTAGRWTLQLKEPNPKLGIGVEDQVNGIVAHVVHSLDAAHMMQTALAFRAAGIQDFGMVHDSYAVHASDVDLMNKLLRDSFVKLHEDCTLEGLLKEIRKTAPPEVKLPEPPPLGPLDLGEVRKSPYLFS